MRICGTWLKIIDNNMKFIGSEITNCNIFKVIDYNLDVTHKEKGGVYNVVMVLKSKDRTDGSWYMAVLYANTDHNYFVRELNDFCKQFKVIKTREECSSLQKQQNK